MELMGKTAKMVSEATGLSYIRVDSELESLLLEARLIRKYMPHYNVAAKDDKNPLYIRITKEKYPRVITARKISESEKNLAFYGPFPSSTSVRSVLRMLRRIFPYSDHKVGKRGCLYSHIGLCNPCPNSIEQLSMKKQYHKNIKRIKSVLSGKFAGVRNELEKEMEEFSKLQKYEVAKLVRDQLNHLDYITRPQIPTDYFMQNPNLYEDIRQSELNDLKNLLTGIIRVRTKLLRIECFDVAHLAGNNATASMVTFINGEAVKSLYRHFRIRQKKGNSDVDSLKEVIKRRLNHLEDWGRPDLVIVDGGISQVNAFTSILNKQSLATQSPGSNVVKIPVVGITKNPDRLMVGEQKIRLKGSALHLVSRIRDEAHRFARRLHHKLVSNQIKTRSMR